ncbi:MAG: hypothetical protein HYR91_13475 [Flavobacteriia bacterium]|nr:hypothetical protein [Flavobacteriia bacterium]
MNNLTDRILFALTAAVAVYIGIFIYLQMESIEKYSEISPYNDEISMMKPEDILEIPSENIDIQSTANQQDIKNTVKDINDHRNASSEDWSPNTKESFDGAKAAYDAEQKFKDEARSSQYNNEVKKIIEERTKNLQNNKNDKKNTSTNPSNNSSSNTNNKYDGQTLVSYDLAKRYPHQNNSWNIRNPGYTCGFGSNGTVVIRIKVNKNGNVISAEYDATASNRANECMIEQAKKYAEMSRFDYSSNAPETQTGKIIYSFISQ